MMDRLWMRRVSGVLLLAGAAWSGPVVLDECDDATLWQASKPPAAVAAAAGAAAEAKALQITLPGEVSRSLARTYVPGSAAWDGYQGLSFQVKGDGSDQFGCLAVTGTYSFVAYFPLQSTEWHQVTVSWADLIPESQVEPIGTPGSMPPSGITGLRFGSRWTIGHNNAPIPPHSFCVDRIQLEEVVPPPAAAPAARPMAEVLALLKSRHPVRIQCMGDSITAGTGLPNRDRQRYAVLMQDLLRRWLGYDDVICESRAVGGAKSTDARAWVPRDFAGPTPDLVTLWIGYNDKSNGFTRAYYKASVNDYLDRVCRATGGRAAILLLATGPGCGPRFVMLDDYAEAIREIGRERGLPVFDMNAFLKAVGRDRIDTLFCDLAHPNEDGHRAIADALCDYLVRGAGIDTPKPQPPAPPAVAPGEARAWGFEAGPQDWRFDSPEVTLTTARAASGRQAVRFELAAAAADHRRAFSPWQTVVPGQRYVVSAKVFAEKEAQGSYGLYVLTYASADGTGDFTVLPVKAGGTAIGTWTPLEGRVEIPEGSRSLRVMVWAGREAVATFVVDDVAVAPLAP